VAVEDEHRHARRGVEERDATVLAARGAAPGGLVAVEVRGTSGRLCAAGVVLMIPSLPTTFCGLWIDTSRPMKLGPIQRFDTAGRYKWSIPVPKIAALRGLVLGIQAVTIPPGPKLQLSTPTVVVIR
jgi:hypothetical protein